MKRVKSACICQTLHFTLKDGLEHLYAVKQVKEEVETYKKNMERNHTKYKIVEQTEQPDGSIIVPDTSFLYESRKFYLLRHHSRHCD